ncbi:transposable element Tcb1 transposase [Trichonephila clavipes]|nr:transposable element Tcb1 transposase [Trichonephila clavipes]
MLVEWEDSNRFQRHDGSDRPTATVDREDILIVRSAVTEPDSSLSTITRTNPASNCVLTIIEDVSGDSWGSLPILISLVHATQALDQELRSGVPLPFLLQYIDLVFQQDNARPHTARVVMSCLTALQTLPWPARSPDLSPVMHVWDMMGRQLHLPGNINDLVWQLE